jgi:hypothetical protein
MGRRTPKSVLLYTLKELDSSVELTARADIWRGNLQHFKAARFKNRHFYQIVELGFLKTFLTWESFLEEAFTLYLLGERAPGGYKPICYAKPFNRSHAEDLLVAEARYCDWTAADKVLERAKRFFKHGKPFVTAIHPHIHLLNNVKTIRNAITHASEEAEEKFRSLVRNELTYYPQGMVPGSFLMTVKPNVSPPTRYFQIYTQAIQLMVETIFP